MLEYPVCAVERKPHTGTSQTIKPLCVCQRTEVLSPSRQSDSGHYLIVTKNFGRFVMSRFVFILVFFSLLTACATNPVSGKRELALVSEAQEIDIGRQSAAAAESELGLVADPQLQAYVQGIGMPLARASERTELPW